MISRRASGVGAESVVIINSRSTDVSGSSSRISSTLMSLSSCLTTWSIDVDATSTTIVIRLNRSSSVGATASDSMLKPRREKSPAIRANTPALFSTRTTIVWNSGMWLTMSLPSCQRRVVMGRPTPRCCSPPQGPLDTRSLQLECGSQSPLGGR